MQHLRSLSHEAILSLRATLHAMFHRATALLVKLHATVIRVTFIYIMALVKTRNSKEINQKLLRR